MTRTVIAMALVIVGGCSSPPPPEAAPAPPANATPPAPALIEIPRAADQPISRLEQQRAAALIDLDDVAKRGHLRILVAPSRTHFETVKGFHHGRAVDAGVALAAALSTKYGKAIAPVFIETREDRLVPDLLAGKGDVAANVLLTFARDEQVAFAPPVKSGIRELIVSGTRIVSLEDIGERAIHVRRNSDHHTSLIRLNEQLKKIDRPPARIIADDKARTDEELLDRVNYGSIPATIVDDYILDVWAEQFPKVTVNRDVSVSQDGSISWVSRKDAPQLAAFLKEFFSTHQLKFGS
jgi:membrane-bound lytic murein transglycosylase MltF